jgi:hypothetical protein
VHSSEEEIPLPGSQRMQANPEPACTHVAGRERQAMFSPRTLLSALPSQALSRVVITTEYGLDGVRRRHQ